MPNEDVLPRPDPTALTTEQLNREIVHAREYLESKIEGFEGRVSERLRSIDGQFALVEDRRVEQKTDTATAVDAALESAEKAVAKTEAGFKEQLSQLTTTFNTAIDALRRENADLKERLSETASQRFTSLTVILGVLIPIFAAGIAILIAVQP